MNDHRDFSLSSPSSTLPLSPSLPPLRPSLVLSLAVVPPPFVGDRGGALSIGRTTRRTMPSPLPSQWCGPGERVLGGEVFCEVLGGDGKCWEVMGGDGKCWEVMVSAGR